MKHNYSRHILTAVLALVGLVAVAQTDTIDIAPWNAISPSTDNFYVTKPSFTVKNVGTTSVTQFYAGVIVNGNKAAEELITKTIAANALDTVTLSADVNLALGTTDTVQFYTRPATGAVDSNAGNDTLQSIFTLPSLQDFPYTWDAATATSNFTNTGRWRYNSSAGVFYVSGKGTNWFGGVSSVGIFNVKAGQKVKVSFDYEASTDENFHMWVNYGKGAGQEVVNEDPIATATDFTSRAVTFVAQGPFQLSMRASLKSIMSYGAFYIKNISVVADVPDVKAEKILAPMASKMATGTTVDVKARFTNVSSYDMANPVFKYNVNGASEVQETYNGTLAAGQSIDYTFATPYTAGAEGSYKLNVMVKAPTDDNAHNDTASATITTYAAVSFPFVDKLDSVSSKYAMVDADGDGSTWVAATMSGNNGILYDAAGSAPEDYVLLPAINMPAGKARFTFYYASSRGAGHLRAYYGTSPDVSKMTELVNKDVTNTGWIESYSHIEIPTSGIYYFAILNDGTNAMYLDNIHVDAGEDLCMNAVTWSGEKSGFNKTNAKVTLSYINYGMTAQSNIKVKYAVNYQWADSAVVAASVAPGDTLYYTFEKPFDISTPDSTYTLIGAIATVVGDDQQNDMIYGESLTHYANATVPYRCTFDDSSIDYAGRYTVNTDGTTQKWICGTTFQAYNGRGVLAHTNTSGSDTDDWAFSDCIEIPKGTYDLSFFYRTYINWDTPKYAQNLKVMIGTAASPDSMTETVLQLDSFTVGRHHYKKYIYRLNVPADGKYYLGFYSNSPSNYGNIYIDEIAIDPVSQGAALPYTSDFANKASDWYIYYPNYSKWKVVNDSTESYYDMNVSNYYAQSPEDEGLLQSPKFYLEGGKIVKVSALYNATSTADTVGLALYMGTVNDQDQMVKVAQFLPSDTTSRAEGDATQYTGGEYQFTVPATGGYYFGLRSSAQEATKAYELKLKQVSIDYVEQTGVSTVLAGKQVKQVRYYNVAGMESATPFSGINIVVTTYTDGSQSSTKLLK